MFKDVRKPAEITFVDKKPFSDKKPEKRIFKVPVEHPWWTPELPHRKRKRFVEEHGLTEKLAEAIVVEKAMAEDFEKLCQLHQPETVGKFLATTLRKILNYEEIFYSELDMTIYELSALIYMLEKDLITPEISEKVLRQTVSEGVHPVRVVEEQGLYRSDEGLEAKVKEILEKEVGAVEDGAVDFLVGRFMQEFEGFDPRKVRVCIKEELE